MVSLSLFEDRLSDASGGCGSGDAGGGDGPRCGNGLEQVYNTTAVRYGYMKHVGEFTYAHGMQFTCGAKIVIQTGRGIETGELVSLSCTGCHKHVSRDQIRTFIKNSGADSYILEDGRILREATADDLAEEARLRAQTASMKKFAQSRANKLKLAMRMVDCEYLLGGERVIFYFLAEGRVDFRALVRELSQEYQTRVKMHQVGARDEARLVADYETCGRQVCCKSFLKTLKPITMRMAKLQRSTLDPAKVSGRCGRLKCCLRYEHESYESLDVKLPTVGEKIETASGFGTVVRRQILTQLVQMVPAGEGTPVMVVIEDVLARRLKSFPAAPVPAKADSIQTGPRGRSRAMPPAPRGPRRSESGSARRPEKSSSDPKVGADESQPASKSGAVQKPAGGQSQKRRRSRRRRRRPRRPDTPGGSPGNRPQAG